MNKRETRGVEGWTQKHKTLSSLFLAASLFRLSLFRPHSCPCVSRTRSFAAHRARDAAAFPRYSLRRAKNENKMSDEELRKLLIDSKVSDVLPARPAGPVVTLSPGDSVESALRTLATHKILSAPVVDVSRFCFFFSFFDGRPGLERRRSSPPSSKLLPVFAAFPCVCCIEAAVQGKAPSVHWRSQMVE